MELKSLFKRKTSIICTLGPASADAQVLEGLLTAGMRVARLNFSHGTHENHAGLIARLREIATRLGRPVAVLQDLSGPKLRLANVPEEGIAVHAGDEIDLFEPSKERRPGEVVVGFKGFADAVDPGERILLADGSFELEVLEKGPGRVRCRALLPGVLLPGKGVNIPSGSISIPSFTEKDERDLRFGLTPEVGVDMVAASFIRRAEDIERVKSVIREAGQDVPVIAKIEKPHAVDNLDEILDVADGVMVARGDLGVEIPYERVPLIQKLILKKARQRGKPAIIATQMLGSMVESNRPTRAEVADVAGGVLDEADGLMLSDETAAGRYPVDAVRAMAKIIDFTEKEQLRDERPLDRESEVRGMEDGVSHAACLLAEDLNADLIVATTFSGSTAMRVARLRPRAPVVALTPVPETARRLLMVWGVSPVLVPELSREDRVIETVPEELKSRGLVEQGQLLVITAGIPLYTKGTTNTLKAVRVP